MAAPIDKDLICRLCLKQHDTLMDIGDSVKEQEYNTLKLEPMRTTNWPSNICESCLNLVRGFCSFKEQCFDAQKELIMLYGPAIVDEITEVDSSLAFDIAEGGCVGERTDISEEPRNQVSIEVQDQTISEFMQIQCRQCASKQKFANLTDLAKHYKHTHNMTSWTICCPICNNVFRRRSTLFNHILVHKNPNLIQCRVCQKSFCNRQSLKDHQLTHLGAAGRRWECDQCQRRFSTKSILTIHRKTHIPADMRPFKCEHCGKGFTMRCLMTAHVRLQHTKDARVVCELCAGTFCNKSTLQAHLRTVHKKVGPGNEPKIKCPECGLMLLNKFSLRKHLKNIHVDAGVYSCQDSGCGYVAPNKRNYQLHVRRMHGKNELLRCNICDKGLKTKRSLREHLANHTGSHLYVCRFCEKEFNSNGNKYKHQMKCHPEAYAEWVKQRQEGSSSNGK